MTNTTCGTCKYNQSIDGEYICMNAGGEFFGDYTDDSDTCYDWESREDD